MRTRVLTCYCLSYVCLVAVCLRVAPVGFAVAPTSLLLCFDSGFLLARLASSLWPFFLLT